MTFLFLIGKSNEVRAFPFVFYNHKEKPGRFCCRIRDCQKPARPFCSELHSLDLPVSFRITGATSAANRSMFSAAFLNGIPPISICARNR